MIDLIPRPIHWYWLTSFPDPYTGTDWPHSQTHTLVLIDLIPMQALASESEGEDSSWLKMQARHLPFGLVTVCSSCKLWQLPVWGITYRDFTGTLDRVQLKDYFSSCISELAIPVLNLIFCIKTRLAFLISCVLGKEASEGEGGETCTAFACSFISTVNDIELLPNNTGQHHLGQTGSCKLWNYGSHWQYTGSSDHDNYTLHSFMPYTKRDGNVYSWLKRKIIISFGDCKLQLAANLNESGDKVTWQSFDGHVTMLWYHRVIMLLGYCPCPTRGWRVLRW